MSGKTRADYSVELDEGLDRYDEAEENALSKLEQLGLSGPQRPPRTSDGERFHGRIPDNLSSLTPREIGEYYNLMEGFANYVSWERLLAEGAVIAAKEKLSLTEAAVRKTKTGAVQQKRDSTVVDHRYVEANSNWIEAKVYFELLKNIEEAARRDLKFISRIVEMKKVEWEQTRRGGNLDSSRSGNAATRFRSGGGGGKYRGQSQDEEETEKKSRRRRRRRSQDDGEDE